jgi:hypothetical protein
LALNRFYIRGMSRLRRIRMNAVKHSLALLAAIALGTGCLATQAVAQDKSGYPYSIMREEGGAKLRPPARDEGWEKPQADKPQALAKKPIRRARGSSSPSPVPQYQSTVTPLGTAPRIVETPPMGTPSSPGMIVPGVRATTGPAMTPPRPAGQSFQDRAANCVQAGSGAGVGPGQIGTYTRSCVNQ